MLVSTTVTYSELLHLTPSHSRPIKKTEISQDLEIIYRPIIVNENMLLFRVAVSYSSKLEQSN